MHLTLYSRELSRVFFKKENLNSRRPWWLSAFYSFCIQSYVRRALIELTRDADITGNDSSAGNDESITSGSVIAQEKRVSRPADLAPRKIRYARALYIRNFGLFLNKGQPSIRTNELAAKEWQNFSTSGKEYWLRIALESSISVLEEVAWYGRSEWKGTLCVPLELMLQRRKYSLDLNAELR